MSTVTIIAASAAAAQREAEDRVTGRLLAQEAVSESRAVPLSPDRAPEARALVRLLERGVVREAGEGRYWLDAVALRGGVGKNKAVTSLLILAAMLVGLGVLLVVLSSQERREDAAAAWRSDPLSGAGVALIHQGRRGVEWEIRCRAAPADLMVVTTARPRNEAAMDLRVDDRSFPLQVDPEDAGAGVFAFGPVTPAFLGAVEDGGAIEVRYGERTRSLGQLTPAQGGAFADGCRQLQQGRAPA